MTDTSAVQGQLAAQDTTRILQKIFTGHVLATPAMGYAPVSATVVAATNDGSLGGQTYSVDTVAIVTVDGFSDQATFTCYYEPRFHWNGSANVSASPPGSGTPCLVAFPPNDPQGFGWVVAFTGWPTE